MPQVLKIGAIGGPGGSSLDDSIDQLQFITNQARSYGPFGGTGGNNFIIELPPNWRLVKFWGMSRSYLDALGIYLQPT